MAVVLACALLAAVGGCGGGSEGTAASGGSSAPTVSAAFVQRADEICHVGTGRHAMIMEEAQEAGKVGVGGQESLDQRHRRADLTWTLDQTMRQEFERMQISAADKPALRALVQALEERIVSVRGSRSVAKPSPTLDGLISAYGLKDCSY
jgi:hypothetical protein